MWCCPSDFSLFLIRAHKAPYDKPKRFLGQRISNNKITNCKSHITDNKLQITITRGCDKAPQTNNYKVCPSHFTHFSIDPNELSLYAQLLQIFDAFSDHGQMMEAIG